MTTEAAAGRLAAAGVRVWHGMVAQAGGLGESAWVGAVAQPAAEVDQVRLRSRPSCQDPAADAISR